MGSVRTKATMAVIDFVLDRVNWDIELLLSGEGAGKESRAFRSKDQQQKQQHRHDMYTYLDLTPLQGLLKQMRGVLHSLDSRDMWHIVDDEDHFIWQLNQELWHCYNFVEMLGTQLVDPLHVEATGVMNTTCASRVLILNNHVTTASMALFSIYVKFACGSEDPSMSSLTKNAGVLEGLIRDVAEDRSTSRLSDPAEALLYIADKALRVGREKTDMVHKDHEGSSSVHTSTALDQDDDIDSLERYQQHGSTGSVGIQGSGERAQEPAVEQTLDVAAQGVDWQDEITIDCDHEASHGSDVEELRHGNRAPSGTRPSLSRQNLTRDRADNSHMNQVGDGFSAAIVARDGVGAKRALDQDKAVIVAQYEYNWFEELFDAGYSTAEVVDLLIEKETQSPWIYYNPSSLTGESPHREFHRPGCIHFEPIVTSGHYDTTLGLHASEAPHCQVINRIVAEVCGLAGLIPYSDGPSTWNGTATFKLDASSDSALVASVSYGNDEVAASETEAVLQKLTCCFGALDGAMRLATWLQDNDLTCDRYTFLTQRRPDVVEAVSIPLAYLMNLHQSLMRVLSGTSAITEYFLCRACAHASRIILALVFPSLDLDDSFPTRQYAVDCCALAVQTVCIGLLGLSNAHLGRWHPFFLEQDLTEVQLHGADGPLCQSQKFSVRLIELSCIGDMLGSPVRVFTSGDANVSPRCDLLTSVVDLLDLWGPGQIIVDQNSHTKNNIHLVKIGDGVIYKTTDKSRKILHWARASLPEEAHNQECFARDEKLLIGLLAPLATLNLDCPISHASTPHQNLRRFHTNRMVHELGTWAAYWDQKERQAGLQGGNFVLATFNFSWEKISSETIKTSKLRGGRLDLQFLDAPWGLQVSACTAVAQRVPLREVVADAMVPMVEAWGNRPNEWEELLDMHIIVNRLRGLDFVSWFNALGDQRRMAVLKIAEYVLAQLSYTGFNDRGELVLAYPVPEDAFACIHIPCKKGQLWTRILKDSHECATFACITSRCLETSDHKCRNSPNAGWDEPVLLVTAVCQYHRVPSGTWEKMVRKGLQDGDTYWMGEPGNEMEFKARLHSPSNPGSAKILEIRASQIPARIRQRMIATRLMKSGRSIRLQERRKFNEEYAEDIIVSGDLLRLGTKSSSTRTNLTS